MKKIAGALAALMLSAAGAVVFAPPAEAAVETKICNSSDSTDLHPIEAYKTDYSEWVYHGYCSTWLNNGSDQLRVDTCPQWNTFSYYVIKSDSGYGPKHYGCNATSNPPDYNGRVYYKMIN